MQTIKEDDIKTQEKPARDSRQTRMRVLIVLGLTILYIAAFQSIVNSVGTIGAALISIPVATAGWFFGVNTGLAASILGIFLSTTLLAVFEEINLIQGILVDWPGNLMVILVGFVSGRLSQSFSDYKQAEAELRSRERFLTLINMTTSDFLNQKKTGERYYFLAAHLANIFLADYAYFVGWDETQEKVIPLASTVQMQQPSPEVTVASTKTNLAESVLQAGKALVIEDIPNSEYLVNSAQFNKLSLLAYSAIGIPLIIKNHKMGAVIITYNSPHSFATQDINRAQQAGDQIAIALSLIQQEEKIQKRLTEANVLAKIGLALSETEMVGIETVFQLIADSTKELIPAAEQVVLHSISDNNTILVPQAISGFRESEKQSLNLRIDMSIAGHVITSGEVIIITDVKTDSRFAKWGKSDYYHSLMVVPVQRGEEKLGTISAQSNLINAFTEEDSRLLGALGIQAAIAIENARLLENTKQALKESNALYRINQELVASLDPQQLFIDVVNLLQIIFGYYHVQIYTVDPDTGDFILQYGSGEIGKILKEKKYRLRVGEGIVGYTAETGTPFFTNNVDAVLTFVRNPLLPETKSELTVPVKIGGRVLGLLDIQQDETASLTVNDVKLVNAVADQLAIALQKANLYSDLQTALQTEKAIRDQMLQNERLAIMGRLLASVSHELNNPLQAMQNALFLLKEEKGVSVQGKQDLDIVLAESERMAQMLGQLRATYRPTQDEDFQPTQINDIVNDVHTLISPHLKNNQITFEFHSNQKLPPIPALPDQIRQVVLNLFMNAVEAMTDGGILTTQTSLSEDTGEVLFTVTDTGPGISPAILPNIFEAFITDKDKGTGLGLTITYDIVIKHRGRITAQNNTDRGSTFKVWLPVKSKEIE